MKKVLVLIAALALAGCEPFPDDSKTAKPDNTPSKQTHQTAPKPESVSTDSTPVVSTSTPTTSTLVVAGTTIEVSAPAEAAVPVAEEPEEKPTPERIVPNAGKLQIIGTSGDNDYYMKRVEQPEAICYVVSNSVTWDLAVSCVPKKDEPAKEVEKPAEKTTPKPETPAVTNVTSGH